MLIDWLTVVAQIVNFLVLVALLKHFLFGRLVAAIDARENGIAQRLKEAEEKNHAAEARVAETRAAAERQEREQERILGEARAQAELKRHELIQKARDEVRELEAKWHEDLEHEKSAFLNEIRHRAAGEITAVVRRALEDLACTDLQDCAVHAFLEKLKTAEASKFGSDMVLRSAVELSAAERRQVEAAIGESGPNGAHVRFETAPEMAWGVELRTDGHRIGWNPESYIDSLEDQLKTALEAREA